MNWKNELREILPALGHRNWILIADAAYPQQSAAGVKVIVTDHSLPHVLRDTVEILGKMKHVKPVAVLDAELGFLSDDMAPGVEALRTELDGILAGVDRELVLHEELLGSLSEAAKSYSMLVIKTPCVIPYTTVFLRLECGYWGAAQEAGLRAKMAGTAHG